MSTTYVTGKGLTSLIYIELLESEKTKDTSVKNDKNKIQMD